MKILCLSDTHNQHSSIPSRFINNEDGSIDTIIHAGDMTGRGTKKEVLPFLKWFNELPFKNKILIAGNHDFWFEEASNTEVKDTLAYFDTITYLNDNGIEIDGIKFWGSPVTPWFHNWAFNRVEEKINEHWNLIPNDINVLITHGPPYLTLDATRMGLRVGCPRLANKIKGLSDLKVHVFGHIHEADGIVEKNGVTYVNASILDLYYEVKNSPVILSINN